jgi:hypothetical protein
MGMFVSAWLSILIVYYVCGYVISAASRLKIIERRMLLERHNDIGVMWKRAALRQELYMLEGTNYFILFNTAMTEHVERVPLANIS